MPVKKRGITIACEACGFDFCRTYGNANSTTHRLSGSSFPPMRPGTVSRGEIQ
jgi:hypothetical protein